MIDSSKHSTDQNILFLFDMIILQHEQASEKLESMARQLKQLNEEIKIQSEAIINKENV